MTQTAELGKFAQFLSVNTSTVTISWSNTTSVANLTPSELVLGNSVSNAVYASNGFNIDTTLVANSLGLYHTGIVNATTHSSGANAVFSNASLTWTGNTTTSPTITLANTGNFVIGNSTTTQTTSLITVANSSGNVQITPGATSILATGSINASSISVGTNFVANTSQITIGSGIELSTNGSVGTAGQVLTSNGVIGSPYWSTISTGSAAVTRQQYTASGSQTVFTVTSGYAANNLDVYLNGVKLQNGVEVDVSSGTTFTILSGTPVSGTIIEVVGTASGASVITNKSSYRVVSSNDIINATTDTLLLANSAYAITLTLPTLTLSNGYTYTVKNINTGAVTVLASGSDLIDGYSNVVIQYKNSYIGFLSTNTGWIRI